MNVNNTVRKMQEVNATRVDGQNMNLDRLDITCKTLTAEEGVIATTTNFSGEMNATDIVASGTIQAAGITSSSPSAAFGYTTGAGGAVTQITSASTGVTLNTKCGQITTVALTTAGAAEEAFVLTNSRIGATDTVVVGTTYAGAGKPLVFVTNIAAGSCVINITNVSASALDALMVINFAVIDAVAA